jgi:hypothetical protein
VADFVSALRETFSRFAGVLAFVSVELRALVLVAVLRLDARAATTPLPLNSAGLAVAATVGRP